MRVVHLEARQHILAKKMNNTGHVYAYDLHENKVNLVKEQAEKLGLINVRTNASDGRDLVNKHEPETFDRILIDRKSTRLNSSHVAISYAVFCLKKKKIRNIAA